MRRFPCLLLVLAAACGDDPAPLEPDAAPPADAGADDFTAEERAVLATMTAVPALPPDPTNAYADNMAAARLGQMLFFDKSYSGALTVGDDGTNHGLGRVGET